MFLMVFWPWFILTNIITITAIIYRIKHPQMNTALRLRIQHILIVYYLASTSTVLVTLLLFR